MTPKPSVVGSRLLLAATDQPQTGRQLLETLKQRGMPLYVVDKTVQKSLQKLTQQGLLQRSGFGAACHPYRYALTAVGRAGVDKVWNPE
jgi:predicted transcriptional regulator